MVWKFCEIWKSYGNRLSEGPNTVRFYLTVWGMTCIIFSKNIRYSSYEQRIQKLNDAQNKSLRKYNPLYILLSTLNRSSR